jgi:DNA-directed RNA polymerase specialized sigma subunit
MSIKTEKEKNYYLPPDKFAEVYQAAKDNNNPTMLLFYCFRLIAENFSNVYNNTSQQDKDAIINYAISEAWRKWDKFDPEVSKNLFSFFTTMISNDMKTHYNLIFGKNRNKDNKYKFVSIEKLFGNLNQI